MSITCIFWAFFRIFLLQATNVGQIIKYAGSVAFCIPIVLLVYFLFITNYYVSRRIMLTQMDIKMRKYVKKLPFWQIFQVLVLVMPLGGIFMDKLYTVLNYPT